MTPDGLALMIMNATKKRQRQNDTASLCQYQFWQYGLYWQHSFGDVWEQKAILGNTYTPT